MSTCSLENKLKEKIDFWTTDCYDLFKTKADQLVSMGFPEDEAVEWLAEIYEAVDKENL